MVKIKHNLKRGDKKDFKTIGELQTFLDTHISREGEFALQCGQGENENGFTIIKK